MTAFSGHGRNRPAGGQNRRVQVAHTAIAFVIGEKIKQQGVFEAEVAQQHVRAGHLQDLARRQTRQHVGNLFTDAQTKNDLDRRITFGSPSGQWWAEMATVIVGGLTFASILTLILTPSILMLQANIGRRWQQRRGKAGNTGQRPADITT